MEHKRFFFPYEKPRAEQEKMFLDVENAITDGHNLLMHAPTGIGKTVTSLGPALKYSLEKGACIFFLTGRHTQHELALKTARDIAQKFNAKIKASDLVGKKWLCANSAASSLSSGEFQEFCKALKKSGQCKYYKNTRQNGKNTKKADDMIKELDNIGVIPSNELFLHSQRNELCPYEIAISQARESNLIIADYNHLFEDMIRDSLMLRTGKRLDESILIIDEGHNLPQRCRNMLSMQLSTITLQRAITEAKKFKYGDIEERLELIRKVVVGLAGELEAQQNEDYLLKREFKSEIDQKIGYKETCDKLLNVGEAIREEQRLSFVGAVGRFLACWEGTDRGFCRTINIKPSKQGGSVISVNYDCLDPSFVTKDVINKSICTIMMSGTLTPMEMYSDLLGFEKTVLKSYKDPYTQKNRLNLIIEDVTTKWKFRNREQYKKIGKIIREITDEVPGSSFAFFPSYTLRDEVYPFYAPKAQKTILREKRGMSAEEKTVFLEKFRQNKANGAVMLGICQGSFGEGVDLPGELLKCVIVVGIPLSRPDLQTKDLIEYYEDKYGAGMNYGYIYPAITKTLQNAGRCIRSENDRGAIIFMDARYNWENYRECFPPDWDISVTKLWKEKVRNFFSSNVGQ